MHTQIFSSSAQRATFFLFFMSLMSCPGLHLGKTGWRSILYIPQPNIMRNSMRLLLADLINTDNLSPLAGARPFLVMTVYSIHGNKKAGGSTGLLEGFVPLTQNYQTRIRRLISSRGKKNLPWMSLFCYFSKLSVHFCCLFSAPVCEKPSVSFRRSS